jgi:hypothetical protein
MDYTITTHTMKSKEIKLNFYIIKYFWEINQCGLHYYNSQNAQGSFYFLED